MKTTKKLIAISLAMTTFMTMSLAIGEVVEFKPSVNIAQAKYDLERQFLSNHEPIAKDANWQSKDWFYVGVFDNGSRRTGYAEYVCGEGYDRGIRGFWVKVIDIKALVQHGEFVTLGKKHCR